MFHSDAFIGYENELLRTLEKPDTSGDDQLRAVLPLLAEQIQAHSSATQQHVDEGLKELREDVERDLEMVVELLHGMREQQQQQTNELHATLRGILGFLLAANGGSSLSSPSSLAGPSSSSVTSPSSLISAASAAATTSAVSRIGQRSRLHGRSATSSSSPSLVA
ncbi:unnamed protein product, partial [Tilletia laevis]